MTSTAKVEAFLAEPRNVVIGGVRQDGRPHLTPNWFLWDGRHFYVSTTKKRAKYSIFRRDPRVELLIDDSSGFRAVMVSGQVEIREEIEPELSHFRAIREKHGLRVPPDDEHLASLAKEQRVLLVITPDQPIASWTAWGLDD